mmetsp:Transcript_817/g.1794  ORF Transcript_817/g.1794 Transcript_817/m.1794 type:complete len:322 (-) Transcript_817:111-1076(-)
MEEKQAAEAATQVEAQEPEDENAPKSTSSAMPDLCSPSVPRLKAQVHRRLSPEACARISLDSLHFRPLQGSDMEEVIALHTEWFPVTYDEHFYSKSVNGEIFTLAAVHRHMPGQANEHSTSSGSVAASNGTAAEEVLGIITMSTYCEHHGEDIQSVLGGDCASMCYNSSHDHQLPHLREGALAYILTLGVVDEFRRRGLAQELLRRSIDHVDKEMPQVKAVYLHVVTYNAAAIQLYESMQFLQLARFHSFYRLHGKMYDSFLYARYIHGAKPSISWRLRKFFGPWFTWLSAAPPWSSWFAPGTEGAGANDPNSRHAPPEEP